MRLPRNRNRNRNWSTRPGFTLVEILAVVIIIGIAAAIVVPRLGNTGDIQASSAAQALVANLQYAQNEAIVRQAPITVEFDTDTDSYELTDANGTLIQHPTSRQDFRVVYPATRGAQHVEVLAANFNGQPRVTFDALGAPAQGGQVMVGAGGHNFRLTVSPVTGKIVVASAP